MWRNISEFNSQWLSICLGSSMVRTDASYASNVGSIPALGNIYSPLVGIYIPTVGGYIYFLLFYKYK